MLRGGGNIAPVIKPCVGKAKKSNKNKKQSVRNGLAAFIVNTKI